VDKNNVESSNNFWVKGGHHKYIYLGLFIENNIKVKNFILHMAWHNNPRVSKVLIQPVNNWIYAIFPHSTLP
jgi:hypothetical protein